MIEFNYQTDFELTDSETIKKWIEKIVAEENFEIGELLYIFCDDDYLHDINVKFLNHDTLTDIISFDYGMGKQLNGEMYISIDRVHENAGIFNSEFDAELRRVIIHGVFHLCGYNDKSSEEESLMREKENWALGQFVG